MPEDSPPAAEDLVATFLGPACLTCSDDGPGRWRAAEDLLERHPDLPRDDAHVAAATGDVGALTVVPALVAALSGAVAAVRLLVEVHGNGGISIGCVGLSRQLADRGGALAAGRPRRHAEEKSSTRAEGWCGRPLPPVVYVSTSVTQPKEQS